MLRVDSSGMSIFKCSYYDGELVQLTKTLPDSFRARGNVNYRNVAVRVDGDNLLLLPDKPYAFYGIPMSHVKVEAYSDGFSSLPEDRVLDCIELYKWLDKQPGDGLGCRFREVNPKLTVKDVLSGKVDLQ